MTEALRTRPSGAAGSAPAGSSHKPGTAFVVAARLPEAADPILRQLLEALERCGRQRSRAKAAIDELLASEALALMPEPDRVAARLLLEVLHDLLAQRWCFDARQGSLVAIPPDAAEPLGSDRSEIKERLRASLIAARDDQLREPTTRRFVRMMERPRRHQGRWVSVLSVLHSPIDFAADLADRIAAPTEVRNKLLRETVRPYLQLVTDERDTHTDLKLTDIWRYCRLTWSLPLSAQPGRQMLYLVRDSAREFHPVIGIGALGSSVVQITGRDREVGWHIKAFEERTDRADQLPLLAKEIGRALEDIAFDGLLTPEEAALPTPEVLQRLASAALALPQVNLRHNDENSRNDDAARARLFRRKRAIELHRLLHARSMFQRAAVSEGNSLADQFAWLWGREDGRRAIGVALRAVKKRHIGTAVMDITTCGALPPYNEVLGGKLVGLLMASPQVIRDYRARYLNAVSEIASEMKGAPVIRPADLVMLGTTSLYHVGSSQYNRLKAPTARGMVKYIAAGQTLGYGSVHLSQRTYTTVQELLRVHPQLQPQNSAFAAGVNYKMRSIGAALSYLNIERLLQHDTPRLVYIVPLATNWREYLTGMEDSPSYIYDDVEDPAIETQQLIQYWTERWFLPRVQRPDALARLRRLGPSVRVSALGRREGVADPNSPTADAPQSPCLARDGGKDVPERPKIPWTTLAELKDQRASIAEHLTDAEVRAMHVRARLDDGLLALVDAGKRVYLTGSPGDGKTLIIRRYQGELADRNTAIHLDASAVDEQAFVQFVNDTINSGRPAVIAVNEGPLRRYLPRLPTSEQAMIRPQLDEPFLYTPEETAEGDAVVVNLGLRQALTSSILTGALDLVVNGVDFSGAPAAVLANREALARQRVQERLRDILQLASRGGAHATMHELFGFLAYLVTGGRADAEAAANTRPYYELAFDAESPLSRWLRPLDPAAIPHPLVDMTLWDGDPSGTISWIERPQGDPPERLTDQGRALAVFRTLKHRFYFEAEQGRDLLALLPEDRAQFYRLLQRSETERESVKMRVLDAFGRFFGDTSRRAAQDQLDVWTALRYDCSLRPTAFVSSLTISGDRVEIRVPRLRSPLPELIEYEPWHVRLLVYPPGSGSPVGLDVNLELWLALMELERGMPQRQHDPVIGRRLIYFMSQVAAVYDRSDRRYVRVQVRDIESSDRYEVGVSIEANKYRW